MKKVVMALVAAAMITLTGCAAMFSGTTQTITFRSNDDTVKFYVNDALIGKGNATAVFHKNQDYRIRAEKEGCEPIEIEAETVFDPITLLGVFIDYGIISILIIDGVGTGAITEFSQEHYVMDPMVCNG